MKKIINKYPQYERVQTGEHEAIAWETEDGEIFETVDEAEEHEFLKLKLNHRRSKVPCGNVEIFDFNDAIDFDKFKTEYLLDHDKLIIDEEKIKFPCTIVLHKSFERINSFGIDDSFDDPFDDYKEDFVIRVITLEEYKKMIIEYARNLK